MSSKYAIEISDLGKCYQIYSKPSDRLKQMLFRGARRYYKEFWALRGVNLKIRKGETVGIIGRNGSGKSTLLQMVCGTLNSTCGDIAINGRVAALLELGAGFNPEFSGIENVYMAASLYGLSKKDIDLRIESIAEFADIGDHINQPVKTYSSGMYVRLAFAVIAHVDADILVVDEALAVGDAVFTQKCMRFIRGFKERGTLLFVSHDMGSVLNLCERAVWLHGGEMRQVGIAKEVSGHYLQYALQEVYGHETSLNSLNNVKEDQTKIPAIFEDIALPPEYDYGSELVTTNNLNEANGWKSGAGEIISVQLEMASEIGQSNSILKGGEIVKIVIKALAQQDMAQPILGFLVRDKLGQDLFGENTGTLSEGGPLAIKAGEYFQAEFLFKLPMLPNGDYSVMTSLADGDVYNNTQHHWLHNALLLRVASSKIRYGLVGIEFRAVNFNKI